MTIESVPLTGNDQTEGLIRIHDLARRFPADVVGHPDHRRSIANPITLIANGVEAVVDAPLNKDQTAPRNWFRSKSDGSRKAIRELKDALQARENDVVIFTEIAPRRYCLSLRSPAATASLSEELSRDAVLELEGPGEADEERITSWALRETRPEQRAFRESVGRRDGLRCALSGCEISALLEAAHLHRRSKGGSDHPSNGVILRVDLHRLFDADLLTIEAEAGRVSIAPEVTEEAYLRFDGRVMKTAADLSHLRRRYGEGGGA